MAEPADINVDELRRRARRRLVGAVVLALGVAVVVPMLLETEQKPLGENVSVRIPPVDDSKFVNRLNDNASKDAAKTVDAAKATDAAKDVPGGPASAAARGRRGEHGVCKPVTTAYCSNRSRTEIRHAHFGSRCSGRGDECASGIGSARTAADARDAGRNGEAGAFDEYDGERRECGAGQRRHDDTA